MQYRPGRIAVSAALCACLLAGCQAPAVTPSPNPTFKCTPEAGGAEFQCSQQQYDDMVAKDKLYAEAEAVYRRFLAEDVRIAEEGGASAPTPVLKETAAGAFLEDVMREYSRNLRDGITARGGDRVVRSVRRLVGVSKGGSVVALQICVDSTSFQIYQAGHRIGQGLMNKDDLYFGSVESSLKIIGADGREVDSCS